MRVRLPLTLALGAAILGIGSNIYAQVESAIGLTEKAMRQKDLERKTLGKKEATGLEGFAPEMFAGEYEDVGPQSILKMNRKKKKRKYFMASADSQLFYTSNTALTENGDDSTLMTHTVVMALAPDPYPFKDGALSPRLGFRHQFFNYGLLGSGPAVGVVDFDSQAIFADVQYSFKETWAVVFGLEYVRLMNHIPTFSAYREFYRDWTPRFELTKYANLSETRFFTFSYQSYYHLSESPDSPNIAAQDRLEQVLLMAYTHMFGPKIVVQPFYRAVFTHYTHQIDRDDHLHSVGFSAFYNLTSWLTARVAMTYDAKESDTPAIPDYRKLDFGVGLTASKRF